jgi:hypothetical protein
MTRADCLEQLPPGWRRPTTLAIVISAACCVVDSTALAQYVPYQSERRSEYGSGLGQEALPPGLTLEPRIDWAVQYADNVQLSSSSESENAFGAELAPGVYAAYSSDRFTGAVDYSLIGRIWDDGDLDDIAQELAANGRWVAVPELFFVNGVASYGDTLIDTQGGGNYGNLGVFDQGNTAEQATASISPMLQKRFRDAQFEASYSYGRVWYLDEGNGQPVSPFSLYARSDSENQSADVSLGMVPDQRRYFGEVFYSWQHSDFEFSIPYDFERAGLQGSLELSRTLSVVGDVGKESALDVSTSAGGLDSDFWSAGLRWSGSQRSSAEVRVGERFFGSSYLVDVRHTARMLQFSASYSEAPEVETYEYNLAYGDPGELPPGYDPNTDLGQFNGQPYVATRAEIGVAAEGSRTTLRVRGYDTEREYINVLFGDEHTSGVVFSADRTLSANLNAEFLASYEDIARDPTIAIPGSPVTASQTYETEFTVRANRAVGPQLTVSLESGYFNHSGTNEYDGWWIGLRGRWLPAFGR